jgi:hypothetical protein
MGFSVLGKGDLGVDELIAGALAVRVRIVQSSALKLSEARAFRDGEKRDPGIVRPVPNLIRSVDIQVNERVLLRPLIAALACR